MVVGHRVVHGGDKFKSATVIDEEVLSTIEALTSLAPLHNPANAAGIQAINAIYPDLPQVAILIRHFTKPCLSMPIVMQYQKSVH